jgi:branched-chain amino acid transport system substrate-binding protein
MKRTSLAFIVVGILFVVAFFLTVTSEASEPKVIKVGIIAPMTGSRTAISVVIHGAPAMIEHINKTGGIKSMDGAKIEMVWGDSASDSATFASEIERLIVNEGVVALVTAEGTSANTSGAPMADRYKIPIYNTAASAVPVFEMGLKYWRSMYEKPGDPEKPFYYPEFFKFLIEEVKISHEKMAFVWADLDYVQPIKNVTLVRMKKMGYDKLIAGSFDYSFKLKDLTPVIAKVKAVKPDFFCAALLYSSQAHLGWDAMYNLEVYYPKMDVVLVGGPETTTGKFMDVLGWEKWKLMFVDKPVFSVTDGGPELGYEPLVKADKIIRPYAESKGVKLHPIAYQTAQAVLLFKKAWEELGTTDPVKVNEYLQNLKLQYGDPDMIIPAYAPFLAHEPNGALKNYTRGFEQVRSAPEGYDKTTKKNFTRVVVWPPAWKTGEPITPQK